MVTRLDFSTGVESFIQVDVSGWSVAERAEFEGKARDIYGVTKVQSAGGSLSYHIYFEPKITTEDEVTAALHKVADIVLGVGTIPAGTPSSATVSVGGGSGLSRGTGLSSGSGLSDGFLLDGGPAAAPSVPSSAWTGISNLQERVTAFKQLAPAALNAVDHLIAGLEDTGHNGGPPLEEREEALEALRQLRDALDDLIRLAETPGFQWADGEGLAASCARFAGRVHKALRHDPIPFAASALLITIFAAFGIPVAGGILSTVAMAGKKAQA